MVFDANDFVERFIAEEKLGLGFGSSGRIFNDRWNDGNRFFGDRFDGGSWNLDGIRDCLGGWKFPFQLFWRCLIDSQFGHSGSFDLQRLDGNFFFEWQLGY